jgi:hypothetical protein
MLDGNRKVFLIASIVSISLMIFYFFAWLLLFKIFGYTVDGYSAYNHGKFGTIAITEGAFSALGYDKIASYSEFLFQPLNSIVDKTSFRENGEVDRGFLSLIQSGKIDSNGEYYHVVRHMTRYVYRYGINGFCLHSINPVGLSPKGSGGQDHRLISNAMTVRHGPDPRPSPPQR